MKRRDVMALGTAAMQAGVSTPEELQRLIGAAYILEARLQLLEMMLRAPDPDLECLRQVVDFGLKSVQFGSR